MVCSVVLLILRGCTVVRNVIKCSLQHRKEQCLYITLVGCSLFSIFRKIESETTSNEQLPSAEFCIYLYPLMFAKPYSTLNTAVIGALYNVCSSTGSLQIECNLF